MFGLDLGVAITETTKVWLLDTLERRHGAPLGAQDLGVKLGRGAVRRLTWRVGPGGKLSSSFAFRRVKVVHDSTERPLCPRRATSPSRAAGVCDIQRVSDLPPLTLALTFAPTVPLTFAASATPRGRGRGESSIG